MIWLYIIQIFQPNDQIFADRGSIFHCDFAALEGAKLKTPSSLHV